MRVSIPCLLVLFSLFAPRAATVAPAAEHRAAWRGFEPANRDTTCKPCDDFNRYANGGWMKANPIPPAYSDWGTFNVLEERNREILRDILETAGKNTSAKPGSIERKVGDYYASYMDTVTIEAAGLQPLAPELERIGAIADVSSLQSEIAHLHRMRINALFSFGAVQDFKNSTQFTADADQGGLGLPDRDYYLKQDERSKTIRDQYVSHVTKMLQLMGDAPEVAATEARQVLVLETQLAGASMTRVARRDPNAVWHKMSVAAFQTRTPRFDWRRYLTDMGHSGLDSMNVSVPGFFGRVDSMLASTAIPEWKTYLRWHVIHSTAGSLSSQFVAEDFDFNSRKLTGTQAMLPRWRRGVGATDRALGEALGQLYVEKAFTPDAKKRVLAMVQNLIAALRSDLGTLDWMGDATRRQAIAKLDAFAQKIGYPDKWRDYSKLDVARGPYLSNRLRAASFEVDRQLGKLGKALDRTEWGMSPPTINAYYNPSMNEIVFPAGILQAPFFDPQADDAINYGGMGAVIGHEMTHGFDDQGRQFDAQGNLKNWWSEDDLKRFQARAECVVKQFDSYVVEDSLHQNGKLVLGESIADLGGLTVAYAALEKSLEGKPRPLVDGYTPEQRFFLGWAQVWAENIRPEQARLLAATNPHPLARFRINGPLSNMPAFAKAFQCHAGDPMVRPEAERCQIW